MKILHKLFKSEETAKSIESKFDFFPFIYLAPPIVLPKEGSGTLQISISKEAAFYCDEIKVESHSGEDASCAIMVRDSTSDRQWFNIMASKDIVNNWKPATPRYVQPGAVITVDAVNLTPQDNELRVGFYGYKDYSVYQDHFNDLIKYRNKQPTIAQNLDR